ncbi:hypothetical protein FSP39_013672, partial [Pinctada imbricata]
VTYKLLSTTLNVHVNQAKQMLYAFIQDQRNKKDNDGLYVTYFVAGVTKPDSGIQCLKCSIVSEENLNPVKSSFASVTSCHIYSVQKSKVKDPNVLYSADFDAVKDSLSDTNKFGAIRHTGIKVRSEAELRRKPPPQISNDPPLNKVDGSKDSKINNAGTNKPAPKKGGIASMFSKQAEKKSPEKVEKSEQKEDKKSHDTKTAKKGVMNFFANHTGKKSEPKVEEKKAEPEPKKTEKVSPPKNESKAKGTKGKKTSRKAETDDDDRKKKRRRIVQESSDSSSEEEMEYESPVPSPVRVPSPPPEREPSPAPESPIPKAEPEKKTVNGGSSNTTEKHRKRRRKLVPKTFMDEDGYMVTEKVWESESTDASDEEPVPPPKKAAPQPQKTSPAKKKASPKKKSPPNSSSRKQMALTSFFTKK